MTARDPLYLAEAEIADRVGVSRSDWSAIALVWERRGFPPVRAQTGKRYWPAVRAWLDRDNGLTQDAAPLAPDGEENHDYRPQTKRSARA